MNPAGNDVDPYQYPCALRPRRALPELYLHVKGDFGFSLGLSRNYASVSLTVENDRSARVLGPSVAEKTAGAPTAQVGLFLGVKERAVAVCCSYQVVAEDGAQVTKAVRRRQNALSSALAQAQVRSRCRQTWRAERVSFPAMCKIA